MFENIKAGLAAAGSDPGRIVKMTTYLTRREDVEGYRSARMRHLPAEALPASTLLFISGLANPEFLIEIDIVAALD